MSHTPLLAAVVAAALLTVAACGDGGTADDDAAGSTSGADSDASVADLDTYNAAVIDDLENGGGLPFGEAESRCMAEGFVESIGLDALQAAGVTPEELVAEEPSELGIDYDDAQAGRFAALMRGCGLSASDLLLSGPGEAGADVPEDLAACVDENVDADALFALAGQTMADGGAIDEAGAGAILADAVTACPGFAAAANSG